MSHKTSHKTSHIALPKIVHTIQRNGAYHYKKRVNKTFVQFSLKTRDPQLASYLVTRINREIMSETELDISTLIQQLKAKKRGLKPDDPEAIALVESINTKLGIDPHAFITLPDGTIVDSGDPDTDIKIVEALRKTDPDFGKIPHGGSGGSGGSSNKTEIESAVSQYLNDLQERKELKDGSLDNVKRYIKRYRESMNCEYLEDINRHEHRQYWQVLKKSGLDPKTCNLHITQINAFADFIENEDIFKLPRINLIKIDPDKEAKRRRQPFIKSEYDRVKTAISKLRNDQQRIFVILSFYTGARVSELGQLEVKDILEEQGILYLSINTILDDTEGDQTAESSKSAKTISSIRNVPIPSLLDPYIRKIHKQAVTKKSKDLFYNINNSAKGRGDTVSRAFNRHLKKEGFDHRHVLYSARHTFKTYCLNKSPLLEAFIDKIQGHASQKTSRDVYFHAELETMKTIVDDIAENELSEFIKTIKMKV